MVVRCWYSRAHCSTRVATSAHDKLSARLVNHSALHMRDESGGENAVGEGSGSVTAVPLFRLASWCEIWVSIARVWLPKSGLRVL
ncbi:unnamed protein product [Mycena citricolor]|uniref:Uncharacterized protein n=1 Tax=Mycena citricolor TaxID=2018698 RepID=A0AAD2HM32_9AGAR|nr:unnamed protein product [Mycena citricolor]